jgi:hypothetical protein
MGGHGARNWRGFQHDRAMSAAAREGSGRPHKGIDSDGPAAVDSQIMRSTARRAFGFLHVVLLLAAAGVARTQPAAGDASQAETLFYDGRKAMDAGEHATACKKFSESLVLLRRASTLVNLAQCNDKLGKLVDALKHAQEALSLIPPEDERMGPAKQLLDDLSSRVPRLTLKLPADLPAQASVRIDGNEIDRQKWAQPISLDPGEHAVVLRAPSREDASSKVVLAERDRKEATLAPGPAAGGKQAGSGGGAKAPGPGGGAKEPDGDGRATRRTIGFVAGGVGLAGLVAAGVTGGMVVANDSTIQANCPNKVCNAVGRDTIAQSNALVVANYVAFGVGALGVAGGAVLVLTSLGGGKKQAAVSLQVSPSSVGLVWQGSFQ